MRQRAPQGTWLVTGAAGYIGGHTVARLRECGYRVIGLDDLSAGDPQRLPADVPLVVADTGDRAAVTAALREHEVTGVMHLAGRKSGPESTVRPLYYYQQNVGTLTTVLESMVDAGVGRLVFSSSAAVYGIPGTASVTEDSPTRPLNPYGETKLVGERLIASAGLAHGISWIALRYFNAVGAQGARLGDHGTTNLIPLAFAALESGEPLVVTGDRFPTVDGTGVRDYVHVADVAEAHAVAVARLDTTASAASVYNVGVGRGYSVLAVLAAIEEVAGRPVPARTGPARPGDPPEVVADVSKIQRELGWRARHDLLDAVRSAWDARTLATHH
jgi:UDP-glucose 4-epimerase